MNELVDLIRQELVKHEFKEKEPPMFRVIILNDDKTPMIFVVQVLMSVFHMDRKKADSVMLNSHRTGSSICGVYPLAIAEMKIKQVKDISAKNKYPLSCAMQEE